MPKFLDQNEVYNLIQREMPETVLATSTNPNSFYTTADDYSFARSVANSYSNLQTIYNNYFVHLADERLEDHEIMHFGEVDSFDRTIQERIDRVLAKIRSRKGITIQDITDIVYTVIGSDKNVEIIEKGCESGSWRLGRSRLSRNTYLGISSINVVIPYNFDPCADDAASVLGVTEEQLDKMKIQAYSYEVRIIGYTATDAELAKMDEELTKYEPARSDHKIISPFELPAIKEKWRLSAHKLTSETYLG